MSEVKTSKKIRVAKGNKAGLAVIIFFCLFNLLSVGDVWEVMLKPIGLHVLFKELLPNIYEHNWDLFLRYTNDGNKYMVLYCWNLFIAVILVVTFFISYLVTPKVRPYLLQLFYTDNETFLQSVFMPLFTPLFGLFILFAILHLDAPSTRPSLTYLLYYSGYKSSVLMGVMFVFGCGMLVFSITRNVHKKFLKHATESESID